jgi:hypothetical protein
MASFLAAHGYNPGPTQRPLTTGALAGIIAALPAVAILWLFGSLPVEARILGLGIPVTLALGCVAMAIAGAVYARLFGRAANDRRGGWLFGMAFSFALWTAGAAFVLPVVSGGLAPAGRAATGVSVSLLVWGCALGIIVPLLQPYLHERLEAGSKSSDVGPSAAASKKDQDPRRGHRPPK